MSDSATRRLPARRDRRVMPYTVTALALGALGLMSGRAEPMAVGVAVAAVVALGLRRTGHLEVGVQRAPAPERVIVGSDVKISFRLVVPADLALSASAVGAVDDIGPVTAHITERHDDGVEIEVRAGTGRWGRYRLGDLVVRASTPGGMVLWQGAVAELGTVTVLPRPDRIDAVLAPPATQISSGAHLALRSTGDGSEFSDLREYQPGDRVRDVNWKVSARRPEAFVNRRHPERGGDVVIVLDAVPDLGRHQSPIGASVLQRMGQAAWALARNHLAGQDRVGLLVPHGGRVAWLPPRGGGRARYVLLDQLMRSVEPWSSESDETVFHGQVRTTGLLNRHDIPPSALVIGLSTLDDYSTLRSLSALRQHGRTTSVLAFDATSEVRRHTTLDHQTVRLAAMLFDARVRYLRRMSTPVVTVRTGDDVGRAVGRLAELTHRSVRRGAA
ncbi:DUF58 domain-containing protein [Ilumatobacter sp.]|uniref:DUF58 domain-containing protein n=1 Tax=Ilumatobacter sp. TaxID=1967498 RepID=UPI003AF92819